MAYELVGSLLGCFGSMIVETQYNICNARQYGTDATCCDNCCRFNCCWKQGALPVEDYPIANSAPEDRTQKVDETVAKETEGQLPAYTATPPMSTAAPGDTPKPDAIDAKPAEAATSS